MNYTIWIVGAVGIALLALAWRQLNRWPDTVNGTRDGTTRKVVTSIPIAAPPTGRRVR
jgi:hypothetical protein